MVVHNETSTGVTSRIRQIREAMDRANHPALLLVDTISSLGSIDYQHDAWGVDVTVSCSQKGLMLPPGLGFNAVSDKALAAAEANPTSGPIGTGTRSSPEREWRLALYARHQSALWPQGGHRHAAGGGAGECVRPPPEARRGSAPPCRPGGSKSSARTRRKFAGPDCGGHAGRARCRPVSRCGASNFDMSLGAGLSKIKGKVFRIGHLGHFNELMLMGTLAASKWASPCRTFRIHPAAFSRQ